MAVSPATGLADEGGITPVEASPEPAPAPETTPLPIGPPVPCVGQPGGIANGVCAKYRKARLIAGVAVAPVHTLAQVRATIEAANRIRTKPYIWGGGHGSWNSPGYDCSGSVSFALHGGGFLETPMDSGEMMHWGVPGKGHFITIYANAGHAFAVIDGLRWDTVGDSHGTGPRWHPKMVSTAGFVARHPPGY
jgi:hypothetical protein